MMENVAGFFREQNKQMKGLLFPNNKEKPTEKLTNENYLKRGWDLTVRLVLLLLSSETRIDSKDIKPTDDKIAYCTFAVSLCMLIFKIHWEYNIVSLFTSLLHGAWLIPDWLLAAGCGIATTFLCWELVYRDSYIPGVDPPTPFSVKRSWGGKIERHGLHLNYAAPLIMGAIVFCIIFFQPQ